MESRKFSLIGILIIITLSLTVSVQAYRTYQNYQLNQRQLQSDIQLSLDNSIETYYADLAKTDIITFTGEELPDRKIFLKSFPTEDDNTKIIHFDTVVRKEITKIRLPSYQPKEGDSLVGIKASFMDSLNISPDKVRRIDIVQNLNASDLENFARKIVLSYKRDTLDFGKLNGLLQNELARQKIDIDYALVHYNGEKLTGGFNHHQLPAYPFHTASKSTFLPPAQRVEMHFQNSALLVLKRGMTDVIVSILLLLMIAGSLYYLYQAIRNQKELAEIKNDLINNITHEFKTPIATVSSALEGIEHFNDTKDPIKTQKYLDISNQQLFKLNSMVEKLLETATLDSEQLILQKVQVNPLQILSQLTEKFKTINPNKKIDVISQETISPVWADPFHLENAFCNILDNAIKYGGDLITISVSQNLQTEIIISDNGGNISSEQKDKVFDKFYRIPKGNVHDVKGFGIGLYYTKKIIEKHGGNITLSLTPGFTTFKITLV